MRSRLLTAALACITAAGCTRGVVSPDQLPMGPSVTVTDLTITPVGGGALRVGGSVPIVTSGGLPATGAVLGAYARFTGGGAQYVDATWTSSDDSIIAIVGGTLVGRGRGTVTLTATFGGRSDTETFVGEGGIAGRWEGTYLVEQCSANSGSLSEILCGAPGRAPGRAAIGTTLPFALDIAEHDTNLTATVILGPSRGTLTGTHRGAGFLTLQGAVDGSGAAINVIHWDTRVVRDTMEGFIGYEIRIANLPGQGAVGAKLTGVTRQ